MDQHSQLQFNLGITPSPANLATNFDPTGQHPVIIDKASAGTIGLSLTPVEAFKAASPERLALAVKLARRNIQRGVTKSQSPSDDDSDHCTMPPVKSGANTHNGPVGHVCQQHCLPAPHTPLSSLGRRTSPATNAPPVSEEPEVTAREIEQLRDKLEQQLARLDVSRKAIGREEINRKEGTVRREEVKRKNEASRAVRREEANRKQEAGRRKEAISRVENVSMWKEERDEDLERKEQRRKEQLSRNARLLYDLSQQVKGLQGTSLNRQLQNSQGLQSKLAATQRAALRTLQNCRKSHDPIPLELILLVQQIALLSSQVRGGANSELSAVLQQLMEEKQREVKVAQETATMNLYPSQEQDNLQRKVPSSSRKKTDSIRRLGIIRQRHGPSKKSYKSPGLLLVGLRNNNHHRTNQHRTNRHNTRRSHFAQQTFNSIIRQEPFKPYTPPQSPQPSPRIQHITSSLLNIPTVHTPLPLRTKVPPHQPAKIKQSVKTQQPFQKQQQSTRSSVKTKKGTPVRLELANEDLAFKHGLNETPNPQSPPVPPPGGKGSTLPESPCHGDAGSRTHSPQPLPESSSEAFRSAIAFQANQLQRLNEMTMQELATLKASIDRKQDKKTSRPAYSPVDKSANLPDPKMAELLQRLEELEGEEEVIRQRWKTIAYEDANFAKPAVIHWHIKGTRSHGEENGGEKVVPLPYLPPETTSDVEHYRERYSRYLAGTGLTTQGGFDPWKMAEKIADDILEDLLKGVAGEMGQLCDIYVDELYSDEFRRPP